MTQIFIIAVVALITVSYAWYWWQILTRRIDPALATWVIFFVASSCSLSSYFHRMGGINMEAIRSNIANSIDVVALSGTIITVLFRGSAAKRHAEGSHLLPQP